MESPGQKITNAGGGAFISPVGKTRLVQSRSPDKKTAVLLDDCFVCWRKLIFPGRHQPSIFSAGELNFRVRDGNGWTLAAINTNYSICRLSRRLHYNTTGVLEMQAFFQKNFKKISKGLKSRKNPENPGITTRPAQPAAWLPAPFAADPEIPFPRSAPGLPCLSGR